MQAFNDLLFLQHPLADFWSHLQLSLPPYTSASFPSMSEKCSLHSHCSLTVLGPNKPYSRRALTRTGSFPLCQIPTLCKAQPQTHFPWLLLMSLENILTPLSWHLSYITGSPVLTTQPWINVTFPYLGKLPEYVFVPPPMYSFHFGYTLNTQQCFHNPRSTPFQIPHNK